MVLELGNTCISHAQSLDGNILLIKICYENYTTRRNMRMG